MKRKRGRPRGKLHTKYIGFKLSTALYRRVRKQAKGEDISVAELMRRAADLRTLG